MKAKRILFCIIMTALLVLRPAVVFAEDGDAQEKTEEELVAKSVSFA